MLRKATTMLGSYDKKREEKLTKDELSKFFSYFFWPNISLL